MALTAAGFEKLIAALHVRLNRKRAAIEAAILWHEAEDKALSKQPPGGDRQWRRLQHQEQIEALRAALAEPST